jgi:hypothetical protein
MLTDFVRLWGTSRIVTGVRSRLKNNLSRFKPVPSVMEPLHQAIGIPRGGSGYPPDK